MYVTNEHIYLVTSIDNKIRVLKINDQFEIVGSISGDIDYYFNEWPKTSSISISPKSFNQFVVDKEENIIFVAPSSGPQVHIPPSKHPDLPLKQAGNWLTEGENFGHYDFAVYADLIEWDLYDKWFDTVIKFDVDGNFLWSRRTHSNPIVVEVDDDCNIYIYGDPEDQDIIGGFSMFYFGETNIISHANMFTFYTRLGHEYKEDGFYKFFVEESVYNIPEGRVFGRSF